MLKVAKTGLILHYVDSFGFSRIFFCKSLPSDFVPVEDQRGPKILMSPHQKFREKTLMPGLELNTSMCRHGIFTPHHLSLALIRTWLSVIQIFLMILLVQTRLLQKTDLSINIDIFKKPSTRYCNESKIGTTDIIGSVNLRKKISMFSAKKTLTYMYSQK